MTVYYTREKGSELTEDQKAMIKNASKMPIVFDEDSPELTDKTRAAFKKAVIERNRKIAKIS